MTQPSSTATQQMPSKGTSQTSSNLHWFFTSFPIPFELLPERIDIEDSDLAHHIGTVMRMERGERFVLVNQRESKAYECTLESVKKSRITLNLLFCMPVRSDDSLKIVAAVSLIKGQKWDWMLQKLTELGISEIIPLASERTVIEVRNREKKEERWLQILKHAAGQSERLTIPELKSPQTLSSFVEELKTSYSSDTLKLVALERSDIPLFKILETTKPSSIIFTVGPEGGWRASESELLIADGFQPVSLGNKILRSETAALYLASVVNYVSKQWGHTNP